jgi:hypothetical protein
MRQKVKYMPTLPSPLSIRDVLSSCLTLGAALGLTLFAAAARSQEIGFDARAAGASEERAFAVAPAWGLGFVASLDLSAGPDHRPRRSLRFRFESATRAMRHLGVDADDCTTVLRSSNRSPGGERARLGLSIALNCRFF